MGDKVCNCRWPDGNDDTCARCGGEVFRFDGLAALEREYKLMAPVYDAAMALYRLEPEALMEAIYTLNASGSVSAAKLMRKLWVAMGRAEEVERG